MCGIAGFTFPRGQPAPERERQHGPALARMTASLRHRGPDALEGLLLDGVALGHSVLALSNVTKGMKQLKVAEQVLAGDLDENWEVLGEAVQTVMRAQAIVGAEGMDNPYERLKDLTRGQRVDGVRMREFVAGLGLGPDAEARLMALTPASYTGLAEELAQGV